MSLVAQTEPITQEKADRLKQNAIRMVQHHKKHCDGPTCNITVFGIYELLDAAGIEVTDEEIHHFV